MVQKKAIEVIGVDHSDSWKKKPEERLKQYEAGKPLRYSSMITWW